MPPKKLDRCPQGHQERCGGRRPAFRYLIVKDRRQVKRCHHINNVMHALADGVITRLHPAHVALFLPLVADGWSARHPAAGRTRKMPWQTGMARLSLPRNVESVGAPRSRQCHEVSSAGAFVFVDRFVLRRAKEQIEDKLSSGFGLGMLHIGNCFSLFGYT